MATSRRASRVFGPRSPTPLDDQPTTSSSFGRKWRRAENEQLSTVKKLQRREIGERSRVSLGIASLVPETFRNFQLQEEFDFYDVSLRSFLNEPLSFHDNTIEIVQLIAAKDVIFVLANSSLGAAFSRTTNRLICILNISPEEDIEYIMYNEYNDSLFMISKYERETYLRFKTTPIDNIRRNQMDAGFAIFENVSIRSLDDVEFEAEDRKILICAEENHIYKMYDLKDYSLLCSISIPNKNIMRVTIRSGTLVVMSRISSAITVTIISLEDGRRLKSFRHSLHYTKAISYIDLLDDKLIVQQVDKSLQIVDMRNMEVVEIRPNEPRKNLTYVYLNKKQHFLPFFGRKGEVWNFRGEVVTKFEDHDPWSPRFTPATTYISHDRNTIISHCRTRESNGSINISDIISGRRIARLAASDDALKICPRRSGDSDRTSIKSTISDALQDVTMVFYDEAEDILYTANKEGLIHVWHN